MGATTTPLTSLLPKLRQDNPTLTFTEGEHFLWSPDTQTIKYRPSAEPGLLLHELAHALLGHHSYERDIQLLAMERSAWEEAQRLAVTYGVSIPSQITEDHLDTYRDWLHARSTCPTCTATGYQTGAKTYSCPACSQEWRVNEARLCGLRRTKV